MHSPAIDLFYLFANLLCIGLGSSLILMRKSQAQLHHLRHLRTGFSHIPCPPPYLLSQQLLTFLTNRRLHSPHAFHFVSLLTPRFYNKRPYLPPLQKISLFQPSLPSTLHLLPQGPVGRDQTATGSGKLPTRRKRDQTNSSIC